MNRIFAGALCAAMSIAAGRASATIISFSGATPGTTVTTYAESGFTLALSSLYGSSPATIGGTSANPDLLLPGATVVDLTGGLFTLGTFSYGNVAVTNGAGNLTVTGYLNGVQTFTTSINPYMQTMMSRDPGSGSQIFDRVRFSSQTFSNGGAAIDSITVNTVVATVPEAASWAMMIGGFGLIGAALRRSKAGVPARRAAA